MHMDVCLNVFLYIMCMLVPKEAARGLRSLETRVIDSCGWVLGTKPGSSSTSTVLTTKPPLMREKLKIKIVHLILWHKEAKI